MFQPAHKIVYKVLLVAVISAFLLWTVINWRLWSRQQKVKEKAVEVLEQRKVNKQVVSDSLLAESYVPPTVAPEVKERLPKVTVKATQANIEPAIILKKGPDYIELITQATDVPFTIGKERTLFFEAKESEGAVEAGNPVDFSALRKDQIVYLVKNRLGIVEKVLVKF